MKKVGSLIVSWDFSRGDDIGVLIVGEQSNGKVDIVNAFRGKEAHEIYKRLVTKPEGEKT